MWNVNRTNSLKPLFWLKQINYCLQVCNLFRYKKIYHGMSQGLSFFNSVTLPVSWLFHSRPLSSVYIWLGSQEHLVYRYFYRGFLVIWLLQTGFQWQASHWYWLCEGTSLMCCDRGFAYLLLAMQFASLVTKQTVCSALSVISIMKLLKKWGEFHGQFSMRVLSEWAHKQSQCRGYSAGSV